VSKLPIEEIESGSSENEMWLTPIAHEQDMDIEKFKERMEKYNNGTTMPNLTMQVKSKMWLTPSATNITERSEEGLKKREEMRNKSGRKTVPPGSLAEQVKYGYPITDMREAKMWPTPTARDYKGQNSMEHLLKNTRHQTQLPNRLKLMGVNGQLNPEWVEWLMGYPIGWTDLNH
jgi:DNA (cytosine-5)-methyltransferase 1